MAALLMRFSPVAGLGVAAGMAIEKGSCRSSQRIAWGLLACHCRPPRTRPCRTSNLPSTRSRSGMIRARVEILVQTHTRTHVFNLACTLTSRIPTCADDISDTNAPCCTYRSSKTSPTRDSTLNCFPQAFSLRRGEMMTGPLCQRQAHGLLLLRPSPPWRGGRQWRVGMRLPLRPGGGDPLCRASPTLLASTILAPR